ncbi:MAG: 2OG-Fe(II) oxygenase [Pseudomonadota bacterium]
MNKFQGCDEEQETVDAALNRVAQYDWASIKEQLNRDGCAVLPSLLRQDDCRQIASRYDDGEIFRSHIHMKQHGFGQGEYKYYAYPLPDLVGQLRGALYARLVAIANAWADRMGTGIHYPDQHSDYLDRCHASGQKRPTPLLLRYVEGDFNCLHQDLYGDLFFPLQVACLLSEPERDFEGGEFVLTEQRPRMQSRPQVVSLGQGDAAVFAVNTRPVRGKQRDYRVTMRHGVSRLRRGRRHTLGIIFHDAK